MIRPRQQVGNSNSVNGNPGRQPLIRNINKTSSTMDNSNNDTGFCRSNAFVGSRTETGMVQHVRVCMCACMRARYSASGWWWECKKACSSGQAAAVTAACECHTTARQMHYAEPGQTNQCSSCSSSNGGSCSGSCAPRGALMASKWAAR